MEPLNSKERTSSIVKLILLLIVLNIIVVLAFLPDPYVSAKENNLLKKENKELKEEQKKQEESFKAINEIHKKFLVLEAKDNDPYLTREIEAHLLKLVPSGNDSSISSKLENNFSFAYTKLIEAKKASLESAGSDKKIIELQTELKDLKEEFKDCEKDYNDCMRNNK